MTLWCCGRRDWNGSLGLWPEQVGCARSCSAGESAQSTNTQKPSFPRRQRARILPPAHLVSLRLELRLALPKLRRQLLDCRRLRVHLRLQAIQLCTERLARRARLRGLGPRRLELMAKAFGTLALGRSCRLRLLCAVRLQLPGLEDELELLVADWFGWRLRSGGETRLRRSGSATRVLFLPCPVAKANDRLRARCGRTPAPGSARRQAQHG
jgi:hypothetical protein